MSQPLTVEEEIRTVLADYDRAKAAFDALYNPWAQRLFAHPMPARYTNVLNEFTAATEAIEDGAAERIRALLAMLDRPERVS